MRAHGLLVISPQPCEIWPDVTSDPEASALADALMRRGHGLDFGGYARTGLLRRLNKYVRDSGFGDCGAYATYLAEHEHEHEYEHEYERLNAAMLVHRTEFFRDPDAWISLRRVLPALLARKPSGEKVRVWCAGCATGQEAYSVAMTFAEQLGFEAYRERVTVFATDVSEPVLQFARAGSYSANAMQGVPDALRARYFEFSRIDGTWKARAELRSRIVFGRHDLMRDQHLRHMDVIACRNTLIYFTASARRQILLRFCMSLRRHGVFFTGNTEIPQASVELFARLANDHPLYRPAPSADLRALQMLLKTMHERRRAQGKLKALAP